MTLSRIQHVCKRAYRALELSGYARIDLRLDEAGHVLGARGESEPADRAGRRLRGVGRKDRDGIRRASAADYQLGSAVAAESVGVIVG